MTQRAIDEHRLTLRDRVGIVDAAAPPERLAAMRILLGVFSLSYLAIRVHVFVELGERDAGRFDPVGALAWMHTPQPRPVVVAVVVITVVSGIGFAAGAWYRLTGPIHAVGFLLLATYRSSWGQLLHFENMIVLLLVVVALAPAANAWSIDARRLGPQGPRRDPVAYGWPLRLACVVVCSTYVIAGIAKLRLGGVDWVVGDSLRNHVAYSATRLELLGGSPSPLAALVVPHAWLFPPLATFALAVELAAPIALLGGRVRTVWVAAAWSMHAGIYALMLVGFPAPLFLIAFAPFFRLERLADLTRVGPRWLGLLLHHAKEPPAEQGVLGARGGT